jgi:hypothetical protein
MNTKERAVRSIFDEDDDDDENPEEGVIIGGKKSGSIKSSSSYSRFDEEDEDELRSEANTVSRIERDKVVAKNALLESIVQELRQEIFSLKLEMANLKASIPSYSEYAQDHRSLDPVEEITDRKFSSNEEMHAPQLVKQSRLPHGMQSTNSSEWERLAQLEKERRQTKRSSAHRRSKRQAKTQTVNHKEESNFTSGSACLQNPSAISSNENVKRRDPFFDASSDESSDAEHIEIINPQHPKDFSLSRNDDFVWDDECGDIPSRVGENFASNVDSLTIHEDKVQIESQVLQWARGKDIVSMIASLRLIFYGPLDYRLPTAWTWNGTDVAERSSISDADIRKAYLRAVRFVHPDKQPHAEKIVQIQAQAVFTALSDAYAAHTK